MRTKLALLLIMFLTPMLIGCGDSDEFNVGSTTVSNNQFTNLLPSLSGVTGQLQLQTLVAAQTVTVVSDPNVPNVVDEYRITGFNEDRILVFGPVIRAKSGDILLEQVPVEVVSIRVELMADGLVVGGLSAPVTITEGTIFAIVNPDFTFVVDATGESSGITAFGSFVGGIQFVETEGEGGPDFKVNFDTVINQVGVTSQNSGEDFQVSEAGDYLITVTIQVDSTEGDENFSIAVNDIIALDTPFVVRGSDKSFTAQYILSLSANDVLSVELDGGDFVDINESFLTILRLGATPANEN